MDAFCYLILGYCYIFEVNFTQTHKKMQTLCQVIVKLLSNQHSKIVQQKQQQRQPTTT